MILVKIFLKNITSKPLCEKGLESAQSSIPGRQTPFSVSTRKWMGHNDQTFKFSSSRHKSNFPKDSSELFCGFIVHISIFIIFIFFFTQYPQMK